MYALKNKVQLIGNLGSAPDIRVFEASASKMARFSVATNEVYYDKEGKKVEDTQWHNVVCWGKLAEQMQRLLQKGTEVALEGKLVNRSYEGKDGTKRYVTEIQAVEVLVLSKGAGKASM